MLFGFLKQYGLRMSFQPCRWIRCNEIGQRNRELSIQIMLSKLHWTELVTQNLFSTVSLK